MDKIYDRSTVERIIGKYKSLLDGIVDPKQVDKLEGLLSQHIDTPISQIAEQIMDREYFKARFGEKNGRTLAEKLRWEANRFLKEPGSPKDNYRNSTLLNLYNHYIAKDPAYCEDLPSGFGMASLLKLEMYLFEKGLIEKIPIADFLRSKERLHKVTITNDTMVQYL